MLSLGGDHLGDHRPNQLWQTDFAYLKVIGWAWFHPLSKLFDKPQREKALFEDLA
jgi:hypothetical protein